jgi:ABC-type uncharacterized transport system ATPase subunit
MAVMLTVDLTEQIEMLAPAELTQAAAVVVFNQPTQTMDWAATAGLA